MIKYRSGSDLSWVRVPSSTLKKETMKIASFFLSINKNIETQNLKTSELFWSLKF